MLIKPASCADCTLYEKYDCKGYIEPEGSGSLGVMVVGDYGGAMDALDGKPFRPYADSGAVLERVWSRCGWARDQFYLTNVIHCRPPNNKLEGEKYELQAIASCTKYLAQEIRDFKPKCIVALGPVAARVLTGMSGPQQGIQAIQGFPMRAQDYDVPVVPAIHPRFLRQGKMSWLGLLVVAFKRAVQIARTGMVPKPEFKYQERAVIKELEAFRDEVRRNPELLLAFDIETDYSLKNDENDVVGDGSNIVLVQFSLHPGTGIAITWEEAAIPIIQEILASPNPKVAHNGWMFDIPMLRSKGITINGVVDDSMWAYHHLQSDLPRGLQSVVSMLYPEFGPWKHLSGMDLNAYGCMDVDVLQTVWPKIRRDLHEKDLWRGYDRHVRQLWPILERMSQHGIPVDRDEQLRFKSYLEEQINSIDGRLQAAYPDHLKNVDPKLGFAKTPKKICHGCGGQGVYDTPSMDEYGHITENSSECDLCEGTGRIPATDGLVQRDFYVPAKKKQQCHCVDAEGEITGWLRKPKGVKQKDLKGLCKACKGKGWLMVPDGMVVVTRWARLLSFKSSQDQLIRYIKSRGHRVPKAIGEDRDTTAKLFIERLAKDYKDPFYADVLEQRGFQKQLSSYIWTLGEDSAVHAKFTFSPATGQLAAQAPNVLTIPAPKGKKDSVLYQLATRFRKTIVARPGHALVAIDYSGFHTSTFAFESKDEAYFRLANKLKDPHSFLTAVLLEKATPDEMMSWDDEKLLAFLEKIKKEHKALRDGQAKPAILGYALGLGGNKLFEQNRWDGEAGFKSRKEADALIAQLRQTFAKGYRYQKDVRMKAHIQGYLKNLYGYMRWFWDVFHHDPQTKELVPGDQAESAIAFNVQCDAHSYLKEALLRMESYGWLERYGLSNIVHDEVFFECELALLEELLANVVPELEKPSEVLKDPILCPDGLIVAADPSIGWNRAEMMKPDKFLDQLATK